MGALIPWALGWALAGSVVAAAMTPRLLPLVDRYRQRDADDTARETAVKAAVAGGASVDEAWDQTEGVTGPAVTGPAVARPRLLALGLAGVCGGLLAAFAVLLPVSVLPLFAYLTIVGAALAVIDARTRYLPDSLVGPSYPLVALLLGVAALWPGEAPVGRALASAGLWLVMFGVPWLVTAGRGIGFGDVKVAPLLGAALGWLGWNASVIGLFAGLVLGLLVGLAGWAARRSGPRALFPFGPSMLAGAAVGALAGEPLVRAYLAAFGLA